MDQRSHCKPMSLCTLTCHPPGLRHRSIPMRCLLRTISTTISQHTVMCAGVHSLATRFTRASNCHSLNSKAWAEPLSCALVDQSVGKLIGRSVPLWARAKQKYKPQTWAQDWRSTLATWSNTSCHWAIPCHPSHHPVQQQQCLCQMVSQYDHQRQSQHWELWECHSGVGCWWHNLRQACLQQIQHCQYFH